MLTFVFIKVGCDRSESLCEICHSRGYESFICDGLHVPFRDNVCDAVLCIAVIHHLSTMVRILRTVSHKLTLFDVSLNSIDYRNEMCLPLRCFFALVNREAH
jgi:ubiquinone/menaquinone biosynthesis C-methylase UbiE